MSQKTPNQEQKHWLYREENRRKLWLIQIAILALAIIPEFFIHHHAYYTEQAITIDAKPGFYAWYGFTTCAVMVIAAKLLGLFLKRKDDYYDE
jgi:hypothetical protein